MSQPKIEKLTPEQEALIPVYREKWRNIALSTERIDRQKATEAVIAAYAQDDKEKPEIVFLDGFSTTLSDIMPLVGRQLSIPLRIVRLHLESQLDDQLGKELWRQLSRQLEIPQIIALGRKLMRQMMSQIEDEPIRGEIYPDLWAYSVSLLDYGFSVLNCTPHDEKEWLVHRELIKSCNWIFPYEKICFVYDRPIKLSLDNEDRLHALSEPAIQFADGWCLYSYHGVTLPEKYGQLHPNEWQAEWLLQEDNAELRRVLIQGIGYSRICQELQTTELDSWQEYTLLRIDIEQTSYVRGREVIEEPIHLLKMTCPSTGHIHVLRVPPDIPSAREAIRWVNWGIDPEEFSAQS